MGVSPVMRAAAWPIRFWALLCLCGLPGMLIAQTPSVRSPALALSGGLWFDGEGFARADWYAVDGRLTRTRPARIDATLDLSGRYVLPPLVEAHNHDLQNARFAAVSIGKNLRQGVFHSVQMCSRNRADGDFAALLNTPGTIDVIYADACISASDGHPLGMVLASAREAGMTETPESARRYYDPVDTLADLDRLWPEIAARRPTLIKIILVNSERQAANRADPATFGYRGLDPALVAPIVTRAHEAGIRVAAHVDSAADFATAVAAGVDIIAHLPGYRFATGLGAADYRIDEAPIAEAARRGTIVVTTTGVAQFWTRRATPEVVAAVRATQIDNLRRLRAAGVMLAIGSDNVMGTVVDEILYLDALRIMPRAELLRRATIDTAEAMFPGREIGAFREGGEASLIAFDVNPLEFPEALRTPVLRVRRGSLLSQ